MDIPKDINDSFQRLLKSVCLKSEDSDGDLLYVSGFIENSLVLSWDSKQSDETVTVMQKFYPRVSCKTILEELRDSVIILFDGKYEAYSATLTQNTDKSKILSSILKQADIKKEIERLLEVFGSSVFRYTAFVFLEGIDLAVPEIDLAGIKLYSTESGPLWPALDEISGSLKTRIKERLEQMKDVCKCYLVCEVSGDNINAHNDAIQNGHRLVEILALFMGNLDRPNYRRVFVNERDKESIKSLTFMISPPISESAPKRGWYLDEGRGRSEMCSITPDEIRNWELYGLKELVNCCIAQDEEGDSATKRLNRSLVWYYRAVNAMTQDEQFVALVTALESLLAAEKDVNIGQRLADLVSMLLGGSYHKRKSLYHDMKTLYSTRCDIVHYGISCSIANLSKLNHIVVNVILSFARREHVAPVS